MNNVKVINDKIWVNGIEDVIAYDTGFHGECEITFKDNEMVVVSYYDDDYFSGTVVFKFNGKFYRGEYVNEIINFGKDRGKEKIDIDIIEVGDDDYTSIHNEKIENMIKDIFIGSREVGEKFTFDI